MQTFLPLPDFARSAAVLDMRRLGKQRVETFQVMQVLAGQRLVTTRFDHWRVTNEGKTVAVSEILPIDEWTLEPITGRGWSNHSVTRMWRGFEWTLLDYQIAICAEWSRRGYRDTCMAKTRFLIHRSGISHDRVEPFWREDARIYSSHRAALLAKHPEHYGQFGWNESPELAYVWPVS